MAFSPQQSSKLIWFQLVDEHGELFQNSTPTSVLRSSLPVPIVAVFRNAAHAKYATTLLKDLPASKLKIFQDHFKFDDDQPLGEEEPIAAEFGAEMNSALLVLVPSVLSGKQGIKRKADDGLVTGIADRTPDTNLQWESRLNTRNEADMAVIQRYKDIAAKLVDHPVVESIDDYIVNRVLCRNLCTPFLCISGSSGTGKTQLAFALMEKHRIAGDRPVFYLLGSVVSDVSQRIYCPFGSITLQFHQCCSIDIKNLLHPSYFEVDHRFLVGGLFLSNLVTFGFIEALVTQGFDPTQPFRPTARRGEQCKKSIQEKYGDNTPVFILDEFPQLKEEPDSVNALRFMRNCFRALSLPLIVMGTNTTGVDLSVKSTHSWVEIIPWCFLYSRLPVFHMGVADDVADKLTDPLKRILCQSRPYFSEIALEYLRQHLNQLDKFTAQNLQAMCEHIMRACASSKGLYRDQYGRHGQLCLFLNATYQTQDDTLVAHQTPLMHHHFAVLAEETSPLEVMAAHFLIHKDGRTWWPVCKMPDIEKDVLLYLSCMGLPEEPPFRDPLAKRLSFTNVVDSFSESALMRMAALDVQNSKQNEDDEMKMEAILSSAICIASHHDGYAGRSMSRFITDLVWELTEIHLTANAVSILEKMVFLRDLTVPYLAPPNQEWPTFLDSITDAHFGTMTRTRNRDVMEFKVGDFITGECKNHQKPVCNAIMLAILKRIPARFKLHIVMTNQLGSHACPTPFKFSVCYRVDSDGDLVPVPGFKNAPNPDRLVLFIEMFGGHLTAPTTKSIMNSTNPENSPK